MVVVESKIQRTVGESCIEQGHIMEGKDVNVEAALRVENVPESGSATARFQPQRGVEGLCQSQTPTSVGCDGSGSGSGTA